MVAQTDQEGDPFRLPRLLYYAGVVTIALLIIRPAIAFTLSDWFFLAALLATLFVALTRRATIHSHLPPSLVIGIGIFTGGAILSSANSPLPLHSLITTAKFFYLTLVWFWLGTVLLTTPKHVETAVLLWVTSVAITGAGAIVQVLYGDVIPGTSPMWGRMTGLTEHMGDLGGCTSIALVPALTVATRFSDRLPLAIRYGLLGLVMAGLVLSAAVLGLLVAMVSLAVWLVAGQMRVRLLVLAGLVLGAALWIQHRADVASPFARIAVVTDAGGDMSHATLWARVTLLQAAWESIERQPFIGVGLDFEYSRVWTGNQVHNAVVGAWFQGGILSFVGMVLALSSVALVGFQVLRNARTQREAVCAVALFASLMGFLTFSMGEPILYQRYTWFPVALLIALRAQQLRSALLRLPKTAVPSASSRLVPGFSPHPADHGV
jgi:O-antigen ligase